MSGSSPAGSSSVVTEAKPTAARTSSGRSGSDAGRGTGAAPARRTEPARRWGAGARRAVGRRGSVVRVDDIPIDLHRETAAQSRRGPGGPLRDRRGEPRCHVAALSVPRHTGGGKRLITMEGGGGRAGDPRRRARHTGGRVRV